MEQRQELMAGRTVLVTGGSGGIGRATALGLARIGADLAICGRDRESTEGAAVEVRGAGGGRVEVFVADLSSRRRCGGWPARSSSACLGLMCWSTTWAATGTPATSPPMVWSAPSPSTIWRRSC